MLGQISLRSIPFPFSRNISRSSQTPQPSLTLLSTTQHNTIQPRAAHPRQAHCPPPQKTLAPLFSTHSICKNIASKSAIIQIEKERHGGLDSAAFGMASKPYVPDLTKVTDLPTAQTQFIKTINFELARLCHSILSEFCRE